MRNRGGNVIVTSPLADAKPGDAVVVIIKPWWKSRTIWVNGATVGLSVVLLISDQVTSGQVHVPDVWKPWFLLFFGVLNIVLRAITTSPVG